MEKSTLNQIIIYVFFANLSMKLENNYCIFEFIKDMNIQKQVFIKENSIWAKMAAKKLGAKNMAMVLGSTVHLWGATANQFLQNKAWCRHELMHIKQYQRYGFFGFIFRYLWQTLKVGYAHCGLECEARNAENDPFIEKKFHFIIKK